MLESTFFQLIQKNTYTDIEQSVPYAFNWQVKDSIFDIGNPIETNDVRTMKILKRQNHKGCLPIKNDFGERRSI